MFGFFRTAPKPIIIEFGWGKLPGVQETQNRLKTCSEEEKLQFLVHLVTLYKYSLDVDFYDTMKCLNKFQILFGIKPTKEPDQLLDLSIPIMDIHTDAGNANWLTCIPLLSRPLLFTHDGFKQRFSCWYGIPSAHHNCLFTLYGTDRDLSPFITALTKNCDKNWPPYYINTWFSLK